MKKILLFLAVGMCFCGCENFTLVKVLTVPPSSEGVKPSNTEGGDTGSSAIPATPATPIETFTFIPMGYYESVGNNDYGLEVTSTTACKNFLCFCWGGVYLSNNYLNLDLFSVTEQACDKLVLEYEDIEGESFRLTLIKSSDTKFHLNLESNYRQTGWTSEINEDFIAADRPDCFLCAKMDDSGVSNGIVNFSYNVDVSCFNPVVRIKTETGEDYTEAIVLEQKTYTSISNLETGTYEIMLSFIDQYKTSVEKSFTVTIPYVKTSWFYGK